ALLGITIIHLRIRPKWQDALMISGGAAFFSLVDFGLLHYEPKFVSVLSITGLSSFAILVVRSIWQRERRIILYAWIPAGLLVASDYFASTMLQWTSAAHPKTLDLYLLYFDGCLGLQIAFAVGRYYATQSWFHNFSVIAYVALAIPITMVYAGRLVRFGTK